MAKKSSTSMDITELKVMATALKKIDDDGYRIQVGVFGDKAARKHEAAGMTNAEVGLIHEMGSVSHNIPRRSFLLDTFTNQGERLVKSLAPDAEALFKTGKVDEYLKKAGAACTNLVVEAFMTSGWGAWAPLKYSSLLAKLKGSLKKRKGLLGKLYTGEARDLPLVDTGQLWQAIAARAVRS